MPDATAAAPRRVLVFRTGSLGDTAFTLPVFHHLNRLWPDAEKRVLTNFPVASEAPPLQAVLGDETFAQGYFEYPAGTRNAAHVAALIRKVRAWKPDVAVYANECRSRVSTLRDGLFLRLCGARRVYGLPLAADVRRLRFDPATGLYEREVARIARALAALGAIDVTAPENRDLRLTDAERAAAGAALDGWDGRDRFLCFSPGTKQAVKDWTDPNWTAALRAVSAEWPELGLAVVGAKEDRARSDALCGHWQGPTLNACGLLPPRASAALIAHATLFVGNDSGPMHLAASVGTPAVAVFSTLAPPGVWFPLGAEHRIFYPGLAWSGGEPVVRRHPGDEPDLTAIPADDVAAACLELLERGDHR